VKFHHTVVVSPDADPSRYAKSGDKVDFSL
jgi:hypothetical protein